MPTQSRIAIFLSELGLSPEESRVYQALVSRGTLTILELSRASNVSRTQVYRLIDELKEKGLIEETVDEHRKLYAATDIQGLRMLVKSQERKTEELKNLLPNVAEALFALQNQNQPETKVKYYRGRAGLRQMVWHTLRAKTECVGFTYRAIEEYVGVEFMNDWIHAYVRKGLTFRDIYSDAYVESRDNDRTSEKKENFFGRYIPSSTLNVTIQMDIYNDVVAHYNWHDGDIFGVEIYNSKVADFYKQLFELVWKMAKSR